MQCIERSVQAFHPSFFLAVEMEPTAAQRSTEKANFRRFFAIREIQPCMDHGRSSSLGVGDMESMNFS